MKKSTRIIVGSALIALTLQSDVHAQSIPVVYGPPTMVETPDIYAVTYGNQDPDHIDWEKVAEDIYGDGTVHESTTIWNIQLNKVLRIHNMNPENWFSFKAPRKCMLRFTVDPSSIDLEYFTISMAVETEEERVSVGEQLIRKDGGIQSFTSPVLNLGDRICWYNQDTINQQQMYEPYLLYIDLIAVWE